MATAANWRDKLRQTEALAPGSGFRVPAKTARTAKREAFVGFGTYDRGSERETDDNPGSSSRTSGEGRNFATASDHANATLLPSVAPAGDQAEALLRPNGFEERAALVEYGAGVPREWAEGFARLDTTSRPDGFSDTQWRQVLDDGGHFLDGRWAKEAAAAGWLATDLFGVHPLAPNDRYDAMGLVPLIRGGEVVEVRPDLAVIRNSSGNCRTYYLRRESADAVALWELMK